MAQFGLRGAIRVSVGSISLALEPRYLFAQSIGFGFKAFAFCESLFNQYYEFGALLLLRVVS